MEYRRHQAAVSTSHTAGIDDYDDLIGSHCQQGYRRITATNQVEERSLKRLSIENESSEETHQDGCQ